MPNDLADTDFSPSESSAAQAEPTSAGTPTSSPDLSLTAPEPLVQPMVRLLAQWVAPWGSAFMRPVGQRNTAGAATSNDNWAANGCYPTCLAMIVRWCSEDNPDTQGQLGFPFATVQSTLTPPELCQRLFGSPFDPSVAQAVSAARQTQAPFNSYDDFTHDFVVDGAKLQQTVSKIQNTVLGPLTPILIFFRVPLVDPLFLREVTLKWWLQFGPVIALLRIPGHFVVIDGYRGSSIYVCDPGNIMVNPKHWSTKPRLRTGSELPPGDTENAGYVVVDDSRSFQAANGSFNAPWLNQISSLDVAFFSPFAIFIRPGSFRTSSAEPSQRGLRPASRASSAGGCDAPRFPVPRSRSSNPRGAVIGGLSGLATPRR